MKLLLFIYLQYIDILKVYFELSKYKIRKFITFKTQYTLKVYSNVLNQHKMCIHN